jgi:phospholipid transport system substrate-binding protein
LLTAAAKQAPAPPAPDRTVSAFYAALDDAAHKAGQGFTARQAAFTPIVKASYDTQFMAQIAAGSYWETLSPSDRAALVAAFTDLTVASYASRFRPGLPFSVNDGKPQPQDRMLVRTTLQRKSGVPLKMSYLLRKSETQAGWLIIDVWLNDQVSELALRRAEFAPVLRNKGAATLIADLRAKIAVLAKGDGTGSSRTN